MTSEFWIAIDKNGKCDFFSDKPFLRDGEWDADLGAHEDAGKVPLLILVKNQTEME